MRKNVAGQKIGAQMISATDGSAFTTSVTIYVTGDAGTQGAGSVGSGACAHEGNGYHTYAPAQAETNYDLIAFTFIGSGAVPATVQALTDGPTGVADIQSRIPAALTANGNIKVSLLEIITTALTAQMTSAFVKFFDKASPTGTVNSLPDAVPGAQYGLPTLAAGAAKLAQTVDLTAGQSIAASSVPAVTLANGAHGGTASTITLGTPISATVPDSQKVDVNTVKTQAVTCAAGVTVLAQVGASGAPGANNGLPTTNGTKLNQTVDLTAGQTIAATVAGAVGSVTGNVGGNVVGSVASVIGAVGSVTGLTTSDVGAIKTTIGTAGAGLTALGDTRLTNLDVAMSTRTKPADTQAAVTLVTTTTNLTNLPSVPTDWLAAAGVKADAVTKIQAGLATPTNITAASGVALAVDQAVNVTKVNGTAQTAKDLGALNVTNINTLAGHDPGATLVKVSDLPTPPTVGAIADQVWDEALSGHATGGSAGSALSGAGSAGDPWGTNLPGAYTGVQAGKIVGDNLNATVGSRSTLTAQQVWEYATRTLTAFGFSVADISAGVWGYATRILTAFAFTPNLDAAYDAAKTAAPTAVTVAVAVRDVNNQTPAALSLGAAVNSASAPTAAQVAAAVRDVNNQTPAALSLGASVNLASAPTAAQVAAAVRDVSNASPVSGSLGAKVNQAAAAAVGAGVGAITWTYTLTNYLTGLPIADVDIWVTTDSVGANVIASGKTSQVGVATFYLDAGTVYVWRQKSGWDFANPDTEVVV
jgi:hypothetical protein